ncbi:MAG: hypothetical protein EU531_07420 [Promethearchaeota archaeon]|nr:MAG: hypothetical protein EU531_07420 [Candidatus Lokiarchaeota archaeon]
MANLLKSGYTMLNLACPVCSNPVFRNKKGDTFCPICNRKVILITNDRTEESDKKQHIKHQNKGHHVKVNDIAIFQNLKQAIMIKLREFTDILENEEDIEVSEKIIHVIKLLVNLISEINKLF